MCSGQCDRPRIIERKQPSRATPFLFVLFDLFDPNMHQMAMFSESGSHFTYYLHSSKKKLAVPSLTYRNQNESSSKQLIAGRRHERPWHASFSYSVLKSADSSVVATEWPATAGRPNECKCIFCYVCVYTAVVFDIMTIWPTFRIEYIYLLKSYWQFKNVSP